MFADNKIKINYSYQRGDIWKLKQKQELIKSIITCYSIGVLVLFINERQQYEILDGQQRLLTIIQYIQNRLDLNNSNLKKYCDLNFQEKTLLDAYCVYYLKLKSHDPETREEDIVQTFLRLQEGTPLNKAEKINAYRGKFKDAFTQIRETHKIFGFLGLEKRFRWRQLAAEMLLIELEGDFINKVFPNLDLLALVAAAKKYETDIPAGKLREFIGNLDYLVDSLNVILTAFTARETMAFYLLLSYLRKTKAGNANLHNELNIFAKEFLKNLNSFSIYDSHPTGDMTQATFDTYRKFKQESKILTTSESIRKRLDIMIDEFERMYPIISKDPKRFHDADQKRILYFRQKGLCGFCGKEMNFKQDIQAHHSIPHSEGGLTDDLEHAILIHGECHKKIEKAEKQPRLI